MNDLLSPAAFRTWQAAQCERMDVINEIARQSVGHFGWDPLRWPDKGEIVAWFAQACAEEGLDKAEDDATVFLDAHEREVELYLTSQLRYGSRIDDETRERMNDAHEEILRRKDRPAQRCTCSRCACTGLSVNGGVYTVEHVGMLMADRGWTYANTEWTCSACGAKPALVQVETTEPAKAVA